MNCFKWIDGDALLADSYTNWALGQLSNTTGFRYYQAQNCVEHLGGPTANKWNDDECDELGKYVCENR